MSVFRAIPCLTILCLLAFPVYAKDVSAKQVGVELAREAQEKAEAEHKGDLQRVAESERRLVEAQKRLAEDRQKADTSKKKFDEANAKLARAQQLLDRAWKE